MPSSWSAVFPCSLLLLAASFSPVLSWSAGPDALRANTPVNQMPEQLKGVGITENLGKQIPIEKFSLRNEKGETVPFSRFFSAGKPVLLSFAYYNCPTICGVIMNATLEGVKGMEWIPGKQFEVVNVSIDPKEGADLAAAKKQTFIDALGKPGADAGWHFLTGEESQIKSLASEIGFGYRYDEKQQEYVHGAGVFILTPEGKISRILYGIQYRPTDLKLSLLEASNGKVGTILDRILLFCYSYDPHLKKYSLVVTRVMQAGALLTTVLMGIYLAVFWSKQREEEDSV